MGRIILITGGTRSGKSDFGLRWAERLPGRRCFIATCPVVDQEMAARIDKHRQARNPELWDTIEEPLKIGEIVERNHYNVYLVDCLTLWISNQMSQCADRGEVCNEAFIEDQTKKILHTIAAINATVIFVTNEVGLGIVPENELARRYRDLVGSCNKLIGSGADEAVLVSCGLPLYLKKQE